MKTKILLGIFLAGVLGLVSGCALLVVGAAAGAGAGTYAYVNGELKDTEPVTFETANKATLGTMKDLGYAVLENQQSGVTTKITVRSTGDTKITVTLTKQSPASTQFAIRVGTFGNQNQSQQLLDKIKSHF